MGIVGCFASNLWAQNAVTIPCSGESYTLVQYENRTEKDAVHKTDLTVVFDKLKPSSRETEIDQKLVRATAGCLVNEEERRSYPTVLLSIGKRDRSHFIASPTPLAAGKAELTWSEQVESEDAGTARQIIHNITCRWASLPESECLFPLRHNEGDKANADL